MQKEGLVEIKNHNFVPEMEKKLVELTDHDFSEEKLERVLTKDFPPAENLGEYVSNLKFNLKIVLPDNILELYVVYHYLLSNYGGLVDSSKFVLSSEVSKAIENDQ